MAVETTVSAYFPQENDAPPQEASVRSLRQWLHDLATLYENYYLILERESESANASIGRINPNDKYGLQNALQEQTARLNEIKKKLADSIIAAEEEFRTFLNTRSAEALLNDLESQDLAGDGVSPHLLKVLASKVAFTKGKVDINKTLGDKDKSQVVKRWLKILEACYQVEAQAQSKSHFARIKSLITSLPGIKHFFTDSSALMSLGELRLKFLLANIAAGQIAEFVSSVLEPITTQQQKIILIKFLLSRYYSFAEQIDFIKKIKNILNNEFVEVVVRAGLLSNVSQVLQTNKGKESLTADAQGLVEFFNELKDQADRIAFLRELSLVDAVELIKISNTSSTYDTEFKLDALIACRQHKRGVIYRDSGDAVGQKKQINRLLVDNADQKSAKKARTFDGLMDVEQLATLALTDVAIALGPGHGHGEGNEEAGLLGLVDFEDEALEAVTEYAFYGACGGLILGGTLAMLSAYLRIGQLQKLKQLKVYHPEEDRRQKQCILEVLSELEDGKYKNIDESRKKMLREVLYKRLRKLDLTVEQIDQDIAFQTRKFLAFGVTQFVIGVTALSIALLLGGAIIGYLTPVIGSVLTVSMFVMVHRFYQKKCAAEVRLKRLEEESKVLKEEIERFKNTIGTNSDTPEKQKLDELNKEYKELQQEIKCARDDVKQRSRKVWWYGLMTTACVITTLAGVAFTIFGAPILAAVAAGAAMIATALVLSYLGYNAWQYYKLSAGRKVLQENVAAMETKSRETAPELVSESVSSATASAPVPESVALITASTPRFMLPEPSYPIPPKQLTESIVPG